MGASSAELRWSSGDVGGHIGQGKCFWLGPAQSVLGGALIYPFESLVFYRMKLTAGLPDRISSSVISKSGEARGIKPARVPRTCCKTNRLVCIESG